MRDMTVVFLHSRVERTPQWDWMLCFFAGTRGSGFGRAGPDGSGHAAPRLGDGAHGVTRPTSTWRCKVFTDRQIHRPPDCAAACCTRIRLVMALSPPTPLADSDKLEALQRLDQFREWRSLDDKRFCLVCGKIITGRQIQVAGGTRGNGPRRLSCPTERCNSIPMDWVLPTDETLAVAETVASEEHNIAPPRAADHGLTSQLRKFAIHFRRAC
jgi:hypothetical protein